MELSDLDALGSHNFEMKREPRVSNTSNTGYEIHEKVLDKGFVELISHLGNDKSIVNAARVSLRNNLKEYTVEENVKLIRYLMVNGHTSPFEHCVLTLHVKAPIFVIRQWFRHRTHAYNEVSARYSAMPDEFYVPSLENMNLQSKSNKQARGEVIDEKQAQIIQDKIIEHNDKSYELYQELVGIHGLAREVSRMVLGTNLYSEFYDTVSLHNVFNFIKLRDHSHAQLEIRLYAQEIRKIVQQIYPIAYEEFNNCNPTS